MSSSAPFVARDEFASGWRILVASVVGIAFGVTPMGVTYTLGSFIGALTDEFGRSRQQILTVSVFSTLAIIPASLAAGWLVDRFNARRLILLSQIGFGLVFIAIGLWADSLSMFYFFYFLMPLVAIGTTQIAFSKLLLGHFVKSRGLALGIALSGTGLCALTMPPLLAWVIAAEGWRAGYIVAGLVPLLVALPLTLLWIRADDTSHSKSSTGAAGRPEVPSIRMRSALGDMRFWTIAIAFFVASGAATGLLTNVVPMLMERGHEASAAAGALSMLGVAVVVGRLLVGALVDRFWAPLVGLAFLLPAGVAVASLSTGSLSWPVTLGCLVVAGMATGAELDLCAYLAVRYFGLKHFGKLYGALFIAIALGAAVFSPIIGWLHDRYDSYDQGLLIAGAGYIFCGLLLLLLGSYPALQPQTERSA